MLLFISKLVKRFYKLGKGVIHA
ncbi:protein of unknown function [Oenococcus oeni]|uniref:Uncharacterized protein n=1 Tax=Oenococcus oeni TaxID=1247 RepID=A0AAQ2ZET0_OENOE|nr:hypothetical protein OENI_1490002 [Oenococcus oeni]SYW11260.1 hypothetical protein OENI_60109 [Oenococcus oeni]SYW11743.1 hypothetical protein OENI_120030 [Oenococcus oeni]VDB99295.1 protein of unknown function [Oenococcus oeni]